MKKKVNSSSDANNGDASKQKERHIVSWSPEVRQILPLLILFLINLLVGLMELLMNV